MFGTAVLGASTPRTDEARPLPAPSWREGGPLLFTTLNAIAFLLVRPGVSDLWAARARADASSHGVGLTYWFSWFSGASAPGSYSVISPYLSRLLSAEWVLALSAVALTAICTLLVRPLHHPQVASYLAAVVITINVWQGRVPFVLGCAFAAAALLAARNKRWLLCSILGFVSLLGSPVSGAFLGLALGAGWLARSFPRRAALVPMIILIVGAGLIVLIFGNPGPEPLTVRMTIGMCVLMVVFLFAWPAQAVRVALYLSIALVIVMAVIPNGMGSNFARFVWFCLPVAVVALTPGRLRYLAALSVVAVAVGSVGLFFDLRNAAEPASSAGYYQPLKAELSTLHDLPDYRLEVVDDGTYAASSVLLDSATLARGFETQTDQQYNADIRVDSTLTATVYRSWLDHNAVGYVAANLHPPKATSEADLILNHRPSYLIPVWQNEDWAVYRVAEPTPIVALPATLVSIDQARMTVDIPCTCTVAVRTHWSRLLTVVDEDRTASDATVSEDPDGFAVLTTTHPGRYILQGR